MDRLQGGQKNLLWNAKHLREDVKFECCRLGKSFQNAGPDHDHPATAEHKTCRIIDAATSTVFSALGVRMEVSGCL